MALLPATVVAMAMMAVSAWAADGAPSVSAASATPPAATAPSAPTAAEIAAAQHKTDIEAARAHCTAVLATISAVAIRKDPIEEGECGTLAPVELVSVGRNPEVALSPPAIVTCDLAVAIHTWMKADVQPLAIKHLGRPVVRIETMSSYSCRHAYNRVHNKLSEHGKANALDIRGFVTATGETAYVLEDWGPTAVEIAALAAQARKEQEQREVAERAAKAEAAARAVAQAKPGVGTPAAASNPLASAKTLIEGLPKPSLSIGGQDASTANSIGLTAPSKLGGPKKKAAGADAVSATAVPQAAVASSDGNVTSAKALFLRAVHDAACRRFGTTLGPEANADHRNHLHIDLAERKVKTICDN